MPSRGLSLCQICKTQSANYSCPSCFTPYCSVACFKGHKSSPCSGAGTTNPAHEQSFPATSDVKGHTERRSEDVSVPDAKPLRALTLLKWPYVPEESAFPDPLKRDEPKALQLRHYEAIATSSEIRSAISSNPTLPALLRKLDGLRGSEREEVLESLLGVANRSTPHASSKKRGVPGFSESEEDQKALKQLAEAVEKAVRGDDRSVLGLDWTEDG